MEGHLMTTSLSLLSVLAEVPDPRSCHGRRHPLSAILALTVVAMLGGARSYQAIAQFGREKGFGLAHALGFTRGKTPHQVHFQRSLPGFGCASLRAGPVPLDCFPSAGRCGETYFPGRQDRTWQPGW